MVDLGLAGGTLPRHGEPRAPYDFRQLLSRQEVIGVKCPETPRSRCSNPAREEMERAVMTASPDEERTKLSKERDRIALERASLKAEMARLEVNRDANALRALIKRLNRHTGALHAFHDALEAFHQRFGPLGPQ